MKNSVRKFISDKLVSPVLQHSPNVFYVLIFNTFFSRSNGVTIHKSKNHAWIISGNDTGDLKLLSPTPKFLSVKNKPFEDKFEKHFKISPGETALDVGACIGDTTVFMRQKVGDTGRVIAVEPEKTNVKYLKLNLSPYNNVTVISKGAWKEKGQITLHTHKAPTGGSIIPRKERKGKETIEVDTIDKLIGDIHINFAKIDVQSAEVEVLQGADKLLKTADKIIVETHDRYSETGRTYPQVLSVLSKYDLNLKFELDNGLVYAWRK